MRYEMFAERFVKTENFFIAAVGFPQFFFNDLISQETRADGKFPRKAFGGKCCGNGKFKESFEKLRQLIRPFRGRNGFQFRRDHGAGEQNGVELLAFSVKAEFVKIGQNEIGERVEVTFELFRFFDLAEIGLRSFSFDVADL
jgi:hypothetical protein